MKMPPLQHKRKRSPVHFTGHNSICDSDGDVGASVPGVKMRRVVRCEGARLVLERANGVTADGHPGPGGGTEVQTRF